MHYCQQPCNLEYNPAYNINFVADQTVTWWHKKNAQGHVKILKIGLKSSVTDTQKRFKYRSAEQGFLKIFGYFRTQNVY